MRPQRAIDWGFAAALGRGAIAAAALVGLCLVATARCAEAETIIIQGSGKAIISGGGNGAAVIGDGRMATQSRPIGAVSRVTLEGAYTVTVTVGLAPSLRLEGDDNVLPLIATEAAGDSLRIYPRRSFTVESPVRVTLTLPRLAYLAAAGSSAVSATGFDQPQLELVLTGSNAVSLFGRVDSFTCDLSGASTVSARQLKADRVALRVAGAANAAVAAEQAITAELSGAGAVVVQGNPKARQVQVSGAGHISFTD